MPLPAEVDVSLAQLPGRGASARSQSSRAPTASARRRSTCPSARAPRQSGPWSAPETASAFSSRGVYLFPVPAANTSITRDGRGGDSKARQVSSYELHAVDFGSSADKVFAALDRHPFVAGEFVWTGFDHLGEPTPHTTRAAATAASSTSPGSPRTAPFSTSRAGRPTSPWPTCCPHWTWPERVGQVTPVHAFTSGDEAELFPQRPLTRPQEEGRLEYRLRWDDVVYEPGELKLGPIAKASLGPLTSSAPLAPQPACCSAWTAARSATMGRIWPS